VQILPLGYLSKKRGGAAIEQSTSYQIAEIKRIHIYIITKERIIMEEQKAKRTRRTPEQMIEAIEAKMQKLTQEIEAIEEKRMATNQEFDQRVEAVKGKIAAMEQRKKEILAPKPPRKPRKTKKQKIAEIVKQAQKSGMKPEQIAEALGVNIED